MRASLTEVTSVHLPVGMAMKTHAHLRSAGVRGLEGMALWVGVQEGPRFDIRDAIIPEQKGVSGDHGLMVSVAGGELHRINLLLFEKGWRLLAQIHSHPTHAYHSEMDDEYAIATALGAFSLVVPHFARDQFSIEGCATYRLTARPAGIVGRRPQWAKVSPQQAAAIIWIVE